jgi:hypothetical protein
MEVEGLGVGKDFVLYPGGGRDWDWGITGMRHEPGIRPVDVEDLLTLRLAAVVLSHGMESRLRVDPATVELLEAAGIAVHQGLTPDAVQVYNALAETTSVAGLFHSTC